MQKAPSRASRSLPSPARASAPRTSSAGPVAALAALVLAASGCAPREGELHAATAFEGRGAALVGDELPPRWREATAEAFERALETWRPRADAAALNEGTLAELSAALDEPGAIAVRAAVLLAHAAEGPTARRALAPLLERLAKRRPAPSRALDAGDVVAAAALARHTLAEPTLDLLCALADGDDEHPDLEVRVECAATAVRQGRREVVPFLLRVLRAMTPDEALDPPDWERKRTMAWSKSRAAEALSEAAGRTLRFVPDASWDDQMREADALEAALRDD